MSHYQTHLMSLCLAGVCSAVAVEAANMHYPSNRPPLAESAFAPLPLGTVKPRGWLQDQLAVQAGGLTGHLDEFWESLSKSAWKGGDGDSWERGPYYLDGLVPLAYLLDDPRLIEKVKTWMEPILAGGREDGWFGPAKNNDRWPLAVALKVLTQYHEATNDPRALSIIQKYFDYLHREKPDWPDTEWRGARAMENVVTAVWLFRRTGDAKVLEVAESIQKNSFDWTGYFLDLPYHSKVLGRGLKYGQTYRSLEGTERLYGHPSHVVNIAMAIKHPGFWYQFSKSDRDRNGTLAGIAGLDKYHGQVGGRFSGDEHLAGLSPSQGTELCAVVEYMFSLECLIAALGRVDLSDRLEMLAYNGNPGATTADYWAHQYDQQSNQVLCSIARREWTTNGDEANLYGLEPNFGCCTANMHQGWPKFVSHMWMATAGGGLAAVAYGPSEVRAKVGDGATATITQETDYPFDGRIRLKIQVDREVKFPLHLRIPAWAAGAALTVGSDKVTAVPDSYAVIERTWKSGDVVELVLPMTLRTQQRFNNSITILRGPLAFSLRIGEKFNELRRHHQELPVIDWEVVPTSQWSYALAVDSQNPGSSITVQTHPIGKRPFDNATAPVVLKVKGKTIPTLWTLYHNSAADPPLSPVESDAPLADLELVPYGCTRLRITEFPVLKQ